MCYDVLKLSPDYFDRIIKYGMDTKKIKGQPDERTTSEHNIFTSTVW